MRRELTAIFRQVPAGFVGYVEELPGANTQGTTLDEARANLREALRLVVEAERDAAEGLLRGDVVIREEVHRDEP